VEAVRDLKPLPTSVLSPGESNRLNAKAVGLYECMIRIKIQES